MRAVKSCCGSANRALWPIGSAAALAAVAMPDGGAQAEQQDAGEGEDPVDTEEGRDEAAEQGAGHRADLLCGEQHAENAPFVGWRCIAGEHSVDGGVDAAEEEAADELHDGKRQERVGDALDDHGEAGTGHAEAHGAEETAPLAKRPPERRGDGARDAAEREDEAGDEDDELLGERHAIETVFNNWEVLQPTGGAIRMYNKIVAFSIGEMLNDDTAIIHFEKSDPTIRGLYQVINHEFVVHAWPHTTYINREEDMGIPGLRHSKESYNPDHFVEKYDVTLRQK